MDKTEAPAQKPKSWFRIEFTEKPQNPIIIGGFPGFGLVGTISTEFLIKHLKAREIGKIEFEKLLPIATIHESKVIEPLGIFYSDKYNIVILHTLSNVTGLEWKMSDIILNIADTLKAKEIICLEAVGDEDVSDMKTYYFTTDNAKKKQFETYGAEPFKEGMIMGVTGALLLKRPELVSVFFVEIHVNLGDNEAAYKLIEILNKYLGLKVDLEPLKVTAKQYEETLKKVIQQGQKMASAQKQNELGYFG